MQNLIKKSKTKIVIIPLLISLIIFAGCTFPIKFNFKLDLPSCINSVPSELLEIRSSIALQGEISQELMEKLLTTELQACEAFESSVDNDIRKARIEVRKTISELENLSYQGEILEDDANTIINYFEKIDYYLKELHKSLKRQVNGDRNNR